MKFAPDQNPAHGAKNNAVNGLELMRLTPPEERLGLEKGASPEAIKAAYKKLSKQWHPDTNKGDPFAAKRMDYINEAYGFLSGKDERNRQEITAQGGTPARNRYSWDADGLTASPGTQTAYNAEAAEVLKMVMEKAVAFARQGPEAYGTFLKHLEDDGITGLDALLNDAGWNEPLIREVRLGAIAAAEKGGYFYASYMERWKVSAGTDVHKFDILLMDKIPDILLKKIYKTGADARAIEAALKEWMAFLPALDKKTLLNEPKLQHGVTAELESYDTPEEKEESLRAWRNLGMAI